jgi:hypothetical protein
MEKILFFVGVLSPMTKSAGSGAESVSGSQWYISADPDPYQNVTVPSATLPIRLQKLIIYVINDKFDILCCIMSKRSDPVLSPDST